jgi:deoxyinosine 3'endonuclease (endonuclease V)
MVWGQERIDQWTGTVTTCERKSALLGGGGGFLCTLTLPTGPALPLAVRTRDRMKPVYVSVGHRLSLDAAELEAGQWRSSLQPNHVMGTLAAWTAQ